MTNEEIIQEILHEAAEHNLLYEVIESAKFILLKNPKLDKVEAYEIAFKELVELR